MLNSCFCFFITSVSFKNIQSVPFPAVTVCAPNSGKWPALVEALNYFDKDGLIFEIIRKINLEVDFFKEAFAPNDILVTWKIIRMQFDPPLQLDHTLPMRLKMLPIENKVFYLFHFACYVAQYECYKVIKPIVSLALDSILSNESRTQTAQEICQYFVGSNHHWLIDHEEINCENIDTVTLWDKCNEFSSNGTSLHQKWCLKCRELNGCLYFDEDFFIQSILNMFYTWRKYFTKRNLIDSSISIFRDESYEKNIGYVAKTERDTEQTIFYSFLKLG